MVTSERTLVIGGTRGTGRLIAQLLHERGHAVRVLARNPDEAASQLGPPIEVAAGDITKPETLAPALEGARNIIFTAGVHSGRIASASLVKTTDYQGVLNTLTSARAAALGGRFVHLNSISVTVPSFMAGVLNLMKRNTLKWRRLVEDEIRRSGLDYTIIRVGFLLNRPGGRRPAGGGGHSARSPACPGQPDRPAPMRPKPSSRPCDTRRRRDRPLISFGTKAAAKAGRRNSTG